jgi:hypothetical protein
LRIGKADTHGSKPVDVRSFRLLVASEMTDPVIEIVHSDEEDVRPLLPND